MNSFLAHKQLVVFYLCSYWRNLVLCIPLAKVKAAETCPRVNGDEQRAQAFFKKQRGVKTVIAVINKCINQ